VFCDPTDATRSQLYGDPQVREHYERAGPGGGDPQVREHYDWAGPGGVGEGRSGPESCVRAPASLTLDTLPGFVQNKTLTTLMALFQEMASLFPEPVFHIGSDETSALGPCTTER
jgi:hypothetical protein